MMIAYKIDNAKWKLARRRLGALEISFHLGSIVSHLASLNQTAVLTLLVATSNTTISPLNIGMMFYCCRTLIILINYLWIIFSSPLFPPVFASQQSPVKRCPSPRSLCNPNESVPEVFLDTVLNSYFANEFDTAVGGDRELVWWALAGGDEGRWWWEAENGGAKMNMRLAQKQAGPHGIEEAQKQVEKRDVVGMTEEEFKEKEEAERMQREAAAQLEDENTEWPLDQRGFCCDEGFSCVTLTVDSGWVVCWSEK